MRSLFWLAALIILIARHSLAAQADLKTPSPKECSRHIIFLPQIHKNVIMPELGTNTDEVAKSQFAIAGIIQQHPHIPVFSEQVDEDISAANITGDMKTAISSLKKAFPSGIPDRFEALSVEQKAWLANAGAEGILFGLGKISTLHKVIKNRAAQNELFERIQSLMIQLRESEDFKLRILLNTLINDVREKAALQEIKDFFDSNPTEKSVFLIYGKNHDFLRHSEIFPSRCISTAP